VELLVIGDSSSREMRSLQRGIDGLAFGFRRRDTPTISDALALIHSTACHPDVVAILQNRPDEFSRPDVDRFIGTLPLARFVCCHGLWCESEGRNGRVWPPAVRVPARAATGRLKRELDVARDNANPLPVTGSRDETFEYIHSEHLGPVVRSLRVSVISPDHAWREMMTDACSACGCTSVSIAGRISDCTIIDADPLDDVTLERIRDLNRSSGPSRLVAFMTMPREQDVRALSSCNVHTVASKLQPLSELIELICDT